MTDIQKGLSQSEADEKIRRGECNGSFSVKSKSVGRIFADNIFTLFNLINVIIAVLVALVGAYRNMLFMGVILCNIAIGIFQEIRSKRIIDRLSVISAPKAHLLRDGEETILPVSDIVPGDIMLLSAGRQICADGTLVQGELDVDESLLTGESETVTKRPGDVLYSGSFVVSGSAAGGGHEGRRGGLREQHIGKREEAEEAAFRDDERNQQHNFGDLGVHTSVCADTVHQSAFRCPGGASVLRDEHGGSGYRNDTGGACAAHQYSACGKFDKACKAADAVPGSVLR